MGLMKQRSQIRRPRTAAPATSMNLAQFNHWMDGFDMGKWGWIYEHKKIGTYLIGRHRERIRGHVGPLGRPWTPIHSKPGPKVGDIVPMLFEDKGGLIIPQQIRSVRGKRRAVAFRRRFGPAVRPAHAIVRTRKVIGAKKTRWIRNFLLTRGRSMRITKTSLMYGFTPGTRWIEDLQFGGSSKRYGGARIPPRPVVGLNEADLEFIENMYADGAQKRALKEAG